MKYMIMALVALVGNLVMADGVAVLQNAKGRHKNEFDAAFAALNLTPVRYTDTEESFKEILEAAGNFDVVLVSPLFNYDAKLEEKISSKKLKGEIFIDLRVLR